MECCLTKRKWSPREHILAPFCLRQTLLGSESDLPLRKTCDKSPELIQIQNDNFGLFIRRQHPEYCVHNIQFCLIAQRNAHLNICWVALTFAHHLQFLYSYHVLEDGIRNAHWACECTLMFHRWLYCLERAEKDRWLDIVIKTNQKAIRHVKLLSEFPSCLLLFVSFYFPVHLWKLSITSPVTERQTSLSLMNTELEEMLEEVIVVFHRYNLSISHLSMGVRGDDLR